MKLPLLLLLTKMLLLFHVNTSAQLVWIFICCLGVLASSEFTFCVDVQDTVQILLFIPRSLLQSTQNNSDTQT